MEQISDDTDIVVAKQEPKPETRTTKPRDEEGKSLMEDLFLATSKDDKINAKHNIQKSLDRQEYFKNRGDVFMDLVETSKKLIVLTKFMRKLLLENIDQNPSQQEQIQTLYNKAFEIQRHKDELMEKLHQTKNTVI